ncbi:hypothetical protein TIFTF001_003725 [Ficus carica]|uniref:General transcription and DNA repair factor IIH subunit TFB5 n=1 Tax=Ficus carica TaxID=3494 RepID=A0AA87ZG53_FICCA|nr:hypothetical protein TIFTF001_003725 [Ficus carica]
MNKKESGAKVRSWIQVENVYGFNPIGETRKIMSLGVVERVYLSGLSSSGKNNSQSNPEDNQDEVSWSMQLKECLFPGKLLIRTFSIAVHVQNPSVEDDFESLTKFIPSSYLSDIPMAQFIINLNATLPASQKFIIHVLDSTHLFVQPNVAEMIRSAIAEFRDQNSYEKPA